MNRINSKICDLIINTSNNITKKFCYKDIIYLIQKEVTEVLQFRYRFHLLEAILMITTPLLIANIYGRDIGKFDDCFGFYQNITCKERQLSIRMVQHNANHVSVLLLIISLIRVPLTIHDKLIKTKYYYHNLQNSWVILLIENISFVIEIIHVICYLKLLHFKFAKTLIIAITLDCLSELNYI